MPLSVKSLGSVPTTKNTMLSATIDVRDVSEPLGPFTGLSKQSGGASRKSASAIAHIPSWFSLNVIKGVYCSQTKMFIC